MPTVHHLPFKHTVNPPWGQRFSGDSLTFHLVDDASVERWMKMTPEEHRATFTMNGIYQWDGAGWKLIGHHVYKEDETYEATADANDPAFMPMMGADGKVQWGYPGGHSS